jgi:hypothetical protein
LERLHPNEAPAPRTIARVLERAGLKRKRRQKRPAFAVIVKRPDPIVAAPNDLWTIDFKGWWRAGDGARCEPLTVRDAFSRFIFDVRLLPSTSDEQVRPVTDQLFEKYGVPKAIQSDNVLPQLSSRSSRQYSPAATQCRAVLDENLQRLPRETASPDHSDTRFARRGLHDTQHRVNAQRKTRALSTRSRSPLRPEPSEFFRWGQQLHETGDTRFAS